MAKGQKRSNKEVKKPKQPKAGTPTPATFQKGIPGSAAPPKKGS